MKRILDNYGMVFVLLGLCLLFSVLTIHKRPAEGSAAAAEVAAKAAGRPGTVLAVGATNTGSADFAQRVIDALPEDVPSKLVVGSPSDVKAALEELEASGGGLAAVAAGGETTDWRVLASIPDNFPAFADAPVIIPRARTVSTFLSPGNFFAVVNGMVVIAVIAIGMTMVIITGGIDLSVGRLLALSAVVAAYVMRGMGGDDASAFGVVLGFVAATLAGGLAGLFTGGLVARFKVAPFIITLGVMMIARGLAFQITDGSSIDEVPDSMRWLAQGSVLGIPNTLLILVLFYLAAHVFMSRTKMGRYIYAVGGNPEAARLSGVPVARVIVFVYVVCGLLAGFGGCLQASLIHSGTPNMGNTWELDVIAAVVVGGTSLFGGTGRILGTLIGTFIIAVIKNGMNLLAIGSYIQYIVLGAVIIAAVLIDRARQAGGFRKLLAEA